MRRWRRGRGDGSAPDPPDGPDPSDRDPGALAAELAADSDVRRQLAEELRGSAEGRRAVAAALSRREQDPPDDVLGPAVAVDVGVRTTGPDVLSRWRRTERRSLVVVGDSIANLVGARLRRELHRALPGGVSLGYVGLAGGELAGWQSTGTWIDVGGSEVDLGLPAIPEAARRSCGAQDATIAWMCPRGWTVDRAGLHWVDDVRSTGFAYRVDDGPWNEVRCAGTARPTHRVTALGPIVAEVVVRAADRTGTPLSTPTFLGLAAHDDGAAGVVHVLGSPGGMLAGSPSMGSVAALRPDRVDVALAALERCAPTVIVWESINDALALDLDRIEAALASVERALPEVEHVGIGVYEVSRALAHDAGQDALHRYMVERFDASIDLRARWGAPDASIGAGLLAPDGIHPTRRGAADIAAAVGGLLSVDRSAVRRGSAAGR